MGPEWQFPAKEEEAGGGRLLRGQKLREDLTG